MENVKRDTLKEVSQLYEAPTTLNIADLDKIPLNLEMFDGEGKDKDGVAFFYKYAKIDGKDYRIAGTILGGIKALLEKRPTLEFITVIKIGTGLNTRYTVIPYEEQEDASKNSYR